MLCAGWAAVALASQQQEQTQPEAQPPANVQPQSEPAQPGPAQPGQAPPGTEQPQAPPSQDAQTPPTAGPQEASPSSTPKEAASPTAKPKPLRKKRKPVARSQAVNAQSGRTVVRNGGARESTAQLSPGMSDAQAQHQRENTNQLLATTDANLKKVSARQLTSAQQSMLDQINTYVRQSKAASDAGDVSRAHTLAFKAHLLSDELARR